MSDWQSAVAGSLGVVDRACFVWWSYLPVQSTTPMQGEGEPFQVS